MKHLLFLISISLITGCSVTSTIQKASLSESHFNEAVFEGESKVVDDKASLKDAYRIFHQAATGFVSIQSIRNSAEKRANAFCQRENKYMHVLSERTSTPPHILGNFPRIEILFECRSIANVSNTPNTSQNSEKYKQLRELKSLLDDGALTAEEYNMEKIKLLSR